MVLKDNNGNTPAHLCVINNKMGFLKMLIRHNCDLTIENTSVRGKVLIIVNTATKNIGVCVYIFSNCSFVWVYAQEWDCWVIW